MRLVRAFLMVVPTAVLFTSCGGDGTYDDLEEVRDAAVDAGLECERWEVRDDNTSAECSDDTVIYYYPTASKAQWEMFEMKKTLDGVGIDYAILWKDNWAIDSPQAPELQGDLGGELWEGTGEVPGFGDS